MLPLVDKSALVGRSLGDLAARLREIENRAVGEPGAAVRTGWVEVDAALPEGGLRAGALHEWCGVGGVGGDRRAFATWVPPLLMLAHLARRAGRAWSVWIGRRVWLHGHAACAALGGPERSLWVDAPDAGSRLWAIEAALRCPGVVVIADGSGFDSAASRRLQLAAASCGALGVLARPAAELAEISFASTRWAVSPAPGGGLAPRWMLTLVRCKGVRAVDSPRWMIERTRDGGLGCLSPELADGPGAQVAAS
ncbi:MAG: hypothetical protein IT433_11915 [Phycisphaerales bacterium]|nr:hypothetical protein [Phycisphaerales bacterium]